MCSFGQRYNVMFCPTTTCLTDPKPEIRAWLQAGVARLGAAQETALILERPKQAQHGDYATNIALQLARTLKRKPRDIAGEIVGALEPSPWVERVEVAGAGFINVHLSPAARRAVVTRILELGDRFGRASVSRSSRVMVEFVSANP